MIWFSFVYILKQVPIIKCEKWKIVRINLHDTSSPVMMIIIFIKIRAPHKSFYIVTQNRNCVELHINTIEYLISGGRGVEILNC